LTIDEELTLLEDSLRRLKVEYDVFFGGGAKKPPGDTEWRVQNLINKHSDGKTLSFPQRFRYNACAQKYALYSDLWRQKMRVKEEGYRRKQDELLGVQGVRIEERATATHQASFLIDGDADDAIRELFTALHDAQVRSGTLPATWDQFLTLVRTKTAQIRQQYSCAMVEYTVDVQGDQVRLKARARQ